MKYLITNQTLFLFGSTLFGVVIFVFTIWADYRPEIKAVILAVQNLMFG